MYELSPSASRAAPAALPIGVVQGVYPERPEPRLSSLDEFGARLARSAGHWLRSRRRPWEQAPQAVAARAEPFSGASDAELRQAAATLGRALRRHGFDDERAATSFALIRETATRTLGQRHFDVQLVGGWVLLRGMVAEMETGEGKTLTATLPACTAALAGVPVHVVTVNDYLARRDAEWMEPIYRALGLRVGVVTSGMPPEARRRAYACDVTYVTNKEVVFDYLKDRIALGARRGRLQLAVRRLARVRGGEERLLHRGLYFAIVDEADSVLVDEARTPLIISGVSQDRTQEEIFREAVALARELEPGRDFQVDDAERRVRLENAGRRRLESLGEETGGVFRGPQRRDELVRMALTALHCFHRDHHYLVKDEKVQIIDEYTGRVMADRSWEHGLHQMIEAKEGLPFSTRPETLARISYQRFFRRYLHLAGMTGTAREVASELQAVYRLPVVRVPPHRPVRRRWLGQQVTARSEEKWHRIARRVAELHAEGRPVLVGTRSVAASELLAERLQALGVPHRVLNARQDREEADIVAQAGGEGRVTVATNMAGRGTDIRLAPGVAERGGLHVIGSERHEARRIDRQLQGRCGRQGEPGSTECIVSLEDEVFDAHAGPMARLLAGLSRERASTRWGRATLDAAVRLAQRRAERLHSRARRALLRLDANLDRMLAFSGRPE